MSKRLSTGQTNTLFNYFQSPKEKAKPKDLNASFNGNSNLKKAEERMEINNDSNDDVVKPKSKKRTRIAVVDSDSDTENTESPVKPSKKTKKARLRSSDTSEDDTEDSKAERSGLKSFSYDKSSDNSDKRSVENKIGSSKSSPASSQSNDKALADGGNWLHNRLDFLKAERIRDINRNRPGHPDYDEKTVYVPEDYLSKLTPAMRQWWILKSKHYDCVLFFKVGKFYELYHMDAVIGVNHLGFTYMKGEFAHSGFPEGAYGKMASSLVEQGFKVARVEQTETPEMMAERCKTTKRSGKFDKVVNREICQITTQATCVYGAQLTDAKQPLPCYMLAVAEKPFTGGSKFGVCFIDTSIGTFHLGQFDDDKHCSRMLALLAQHSVGLIVTERGRMQKTTTEILKKSFSNVRKDALTPGSQFYSAQTTLDSLAKGCYFRDKNDEFHWPPVLKDLMENDSPKPEYELALKALGASMWYLKDSELDIHMLAMKKFEIYNPVDVAAKQEATKRDFMVLDAVTIENLSLLGTSGTLQKTLDRCETAFGKRLLKQWICRPLCNHERILERQMAVEELYMNNEIRHAARAVLKKLPDLERQVSKIHTFGNRFCAQFHPDSRAVMYEGKRYSKRKILDLISTIQGFERVQELARLFEGLFLILFNLLLIHSSAGCNSRLLRKLTQHPSKGKLPDMSKTLQFFREAFDQKQAEIEGKIIPQRGIDEDYDQAEQDIVDVQQESINYLNELQDFFGCKLTYFGTDKKRFQIEVPEHRTHKVTSEYQLEGTRKGSKPVKRYSTATSRKILADMIKAEGKRNKIVQDLNRRTFEKFSESRDGWEQVIQCLMMLDVLCAFAEYGRTGPQNVCFPTILPFQDEEAYINIEDGVHPCTQLEDFVPNSTKLGTEDNAKIMLLTGPNMGGKSTLMRQVALITVMAQMGCAVPAVGCELSLVDRIFTRLGANDDILQGQSTFLVELSEAAAILQHATKNSFVLLDELGRGTSTHDGNAIATAYVKKLIDMQCRTIFSTHYHSLVEFYSGEDGIQLSHMACMTEDEEVNVDQPLHSVTLLYQLREGSCPKSFGFNAARLAGLPKSIIERAHQVATELEKKTRMRKLFRSLMQCDDASVARHLIANLKI